MPATELEIEIRDDGVLLVLVLKGELDLATAPTVSRTLASRRRHHRAVVLDLTDAAFID